jgi:hypothetical protein
MRIAGACALGVVAQSAAAEVLRFELTGPARPALEGRSFGAVGPYVEIRARATIALDPADPRNAVIVDIDRAPRNAEGKVEATADVIILRPADLSRGSGTLLVETPNRGRRPAPLDRGALAQRRRLCRRGARQRGTAAGRAPAAGRGCACDHRRRGGRHAGPPAGALSEFG